MKKIESPQLNSRELTIAAVQNGVIVIGRYRGDDNQHERAVFRDSEEFAAWMKKWMDDQFKALKPIPTK